ncbi:uncharacterized protein LOC134257761, partial [Saccostrea cucullata]|uniref:uncharacterized protein LOC134257761 n=1 Tax=Saccostrea cuccullata TaxID=36930 RepID=UPI002ECFEC7A
MDQVPDTAQHFIECDTESCRNFSEYYCNACHQRICDQCKQRHLEQNSGHDIVLYRERKRKLPSEKCRIHPTQDIDVHCDVCQVPVCSSCFSQHHSDHNKSDLETIYNDIVQQCQKEITEIWKKIIPGAEYTAELIGEKRECAKKEIAKIRVSMKKRADELKETVDSILSDHNKKLDEIENSVLNDIVKQQKKTKDYIDYLEKMIVEYESKLSSIKYTELMKLHLDISLATLKMPTKSEPKLPILTLGTLNKEEIAKHFGEIELNSSEKFTLFSVTKVSEKTIQEEGMSHLSLLPPNKFWANGRSGDDLIQYDIEGNILQKISTSMIYMQGTHTVTTEGDLLYTDFNKNTVYRVTSDKSINKLFETGSWRPGAIYSSHINGHILVWMCTNSDQKLTRYNREGRKLQDIQSWDNQGNTLYHGVHFVTENINGDICTSDFKASKVVVVTASGEYRFSYSGQESQTGFIPYGICTDVLGHILVCNNYFTFNENCFSVHLLDINGQFLCILLPPEQCPPFPSAICIDDQHNLWIGGMGTSNCLCVQ